MIIVIEGTKGAGKTTLTNNFLKKAKENNLSVEIVAPFALGNEFYGEKGIFNCWSNKNKTIEALTFLDQLIQQKIQKQTTDILLFDRHWITVVVSIQDSVIENELKEYYIKKWTKEIPNTFFIYCEPELTMERRKGQLDEKSGLMTADLVIKDYNTRVEIAEKHNVTMFKTPENDTTDIVDKIFEKLNLVDDMKIKF